MSLPWYCFYHTVSTATAKACSLSWLTGVVLLFLQGVSDKNYSMVCVWNNSISCIRKTHIIVPSPLFGTFLLELFHIRKLQYYTFIFIIFKSHLYNFPSPLDGTFFLEYNVFKYIGLFSPKISRGNIFKKIEISWENTNVRFFYTPFSLLLSDIKKRQ